MNNPGRPEVNTKERDNVWMSQFFPLDDLANGSLLVLSMAQVGKDEVFDTVPCAILPVHP
jgi:hypothetical protein